MPNTFSTTERTTPGYFRIGFVILQIPPTDISTNKVVNDDQVATLRTGTPMFVKTGQSRWDVTITWKAVRYVNTDNTFDYSQWIDLRRIVAMFKAAPFVEVENDFLRQHFTNVQAAYQTQRMAFALRQLRIDTNQDSTNVIDVVLTMSLFNYAPYSKDFGYDDGDGVSVDASNSSKFRLFIDNWIINNMDEHRVFSSSPPIGDWNNQEEGVTTFKWRKYFYSPFKSTPPAAVSNASAGYTPIVSPATSKKAIKKPANDIQTIINSAAAKYGLDPSIVTSLCMYESGGNPAAGKGRTDHGGLGLFQLVASTAKDLKVANVFDPSQNADGACKYLKDRLTKFGNYPHALAAYNTGDAYVIAYRDGKSLNLKNGSIINPTKIKTPDGIPPKGIPKGEDAPKYVHTILTNANRKDTLQNVPLISTDATPPPTLIDTVSNMDIPDAAFRDLIAEAIQNLPDGNWWLDHYTEQGAFFYEDETIRLATADSQASGDFDMYPNHISIALVNNLPVIPLSAMQYPTFQHVGPPDTVISISFNSVGSESGVLSEAEHRGIEALAQMSNQLENQFHNLRTLFRAVSSIHRMQAVFVENQILNLLGIRGTLLRGLNTETVPEAVGLAQVSIMMSQYENIFEDINPFRINGISTAYSPIIKNILTNGDLNKISKAEQDGIIIVKKFADAWASKDEAFLLSEILSISKEPLNFLGDVDLPSALLSPDQKTFLLNILDSQGKKVNLLAPGKIPQAAKELYPGLQKRRLDLQPTSVNMNYADYWVFSKLPSSNDTTKNLIISTIDPKFVSQKTGFIDTMYGRLFDWEILTNPLFNRQASLITRSPSFNNQFNNAATVNGPATQTDGNNNLVNPGHGCYRDLGLTSYGDTPAGYFIDYNQVVNKDVNATLVNILGTANQTANDVNQVATVQGSTNTDTGVTFSANGQGLLGASNALIRMKHLPGYSMNTAYPTFKLMLMEEDNTGFFYAFDNFYSYASVMDIEIIKYRDKPDTAIIQITNLAQMLQHRLYDDTAAGKMEKEADKFNVDPNGGLVSTGEAGTGSNPNTGITAGKTAAGQPYQTAPRKNMVEGRGEGYNRIPLKFFALQTGSKIQVRMGYSNNPDNLYPVFTGQVTNIEGDDILTLTCQSFMLELMEVPGTLVKKNTRLGFNFLSGGAAFGGYSLTNSGDTINIMKTMLASPVARHFGRWQIGSIKDPLIKGFEWTELIGSAMESASSDTISKIGSLLQSGYDRSGENILVNSVNNYDASKSSQSTENKGSRTWDNENPNVFLGTARYSIPKQSTLSVWDVLKDVSRRYPHYNLMVKDYGFPYGADATLVYGHPLDWYYCRPRLYGEAEKEKATDQTQNALFQQWWSTTGEAKWKHIFDIALPGLIDSFSLNIIKDAQIAASYGVRAALADAEGPMTELAISGPVGFQDSIQYIHNVLTGAKDVNVSSLNRLAAIIANYGNVGGGLAASIDNNFQALYREWIAYLQLSDPAANSSRVKPIRKYHLIDYNHIVHNDIKVNDKIFNAIKIKDEKPLKFNQNIPDQHTRVLDVTSIVNDPDQNVLQGIGQPLLNSYAQSFLRDEVGKMYQGELVLRGVPEIEPFDIILLSDASTGMVGPIEVESVIHSFNQENGYITIVKPRLLVLANETVSLGLIQSLSFAWSTASANLLDLGHIFNPFNINTTTSARIIEGVAVSSALLLAAAGFAWFPPIGLTLGLLGLLAGYGILAYAEDRNTQNFFQLMPLSRFGRPWLGGLQGFAISNFAYSIGQAFRWFDAEEIAPTIESWNEFLHYRGDYLLQSQ